MSVPLAQQVCGPGIHRLLAELLQKLGYQRYLLG
jgi:hypothetical protein